VWRTYGRRRRRLPYTYNTHHSFFTHFLLSIQVRIAGYINTLRKKLFFQESEKRWENLGLPVGASLSFDFMALYKFYYHYYLYDFNYDHDYDFIIIIIFCPCNLPVSCIIMYYMIMALAKWISRQSR